MKILWVTNGLPPEATALLGGRKEIKGTGSWVAALAEDISQNEEVELYIASTTPLVDQYKEIQGNNIRYFAIPYEGDSNYNKNYEGFYGKIYQMLTPDVVHIHGTEYPHALACLNACGNNKTVVSIQGLVSAIAPFFMAGLSSHLAKRYITIHDMVRKSLLQTQKDFEKRGKFEIELLKNVRYVLGRTSWDKARVWGINPNALYFHCDENLRDVFYDGKWVYENCIPHTIFMSQSSVPYKGLHKVLEALKLIKKHFPDTQLRIAGDDVTCANLTGKERLSLSSYGKIIRKMINTYHLEDNVTFTGPLNGERMKQEYLKSNVFLCPSSIENSPNSLGEAQILGVPCVASYVGGVPDMMLGYEKFMYRYEEVDMLASIICTIFDDHTCFDNTQIIQTAINRHNRESNVNKLLNIYKTVIKNL